MWTFLKSLDASFYILSAGIISFVVPSFVLDEPNEKETVIFESISQKSSALDRVSTPNNIEKKPTKTKKVKPKLDVDKEQSHIQPQTQVPLNTEQEVLPEFQSKINWVGFDDVPKRQHDSNTAVKITGVSPKTAASADQKVITIDTPLSQLRGSGGGTQQISQGVRKTTDAGPEVNPEEIIAMSKRVQEQGDRDNINSSMTIEVQAIDLISRSVKPLDSVAIEFLDNMEVLSNKEKDRPLVYKDYIAKSQSNRRVYLSSHEIVETITDLTLEQGDVSVGLAGITRESYEQLLEKYQIPHYLGGLLIQLDPTTKDLSIGSQYKYELGITYDFQVLENFELEDVAYVLYLGVDAGNTLVTYTSQPDDQVTDKIIFIESRRLYFEINYYAEVAQEQIEFYQYNVLAKEPSPLPLRPNDVQEEFSGRYAEILNHHTVQYLNTLYPLGFRKYLKFPDDLFDLKIGITESPEVILPSRFFTEQVVYDYFQLYDLNYHCLIHINIPDGLTVKDIAYEGRTVMSEGEADGHMYTKLLALDSDGEFYPRPSDLTQMLFILGEGKGIIDISLKYTNNSQEYFQSYCAEGVYLVEQL